MFKIKRLIYILQQNIPSKIKICFYFTTSYFVIRKDSRLATHFGALELLFYVHRLIMFVDLVTDKIYRFSVGGRSSFARYVCRSCLNGTSNNIFEYMFFY